MASDGTIFGSVSAPALHSFANLAVASYYTEKRPLFGIDLQGDVFPCTNVIQWCDAMSIRPWLLAASYLGDDDYPEKSVTVLTSFTGTVCGHHPDGTPCYFATSVFSPVDAKVLRTTICTSTYQEAFENHDRILHGISKLYGVPIPDGQSAKLREAAELPQRLEDWR